MGLLDLTYPTLFRSVTGVPGAWRAWRSFSVLFSTFWAGLVACAVSRQSLTFSTNEWSSVSSLLSLPCRSTVWLIWKQYTQHNDAQLKTYVMSMYKPYSRHFFTPFTSNRHARFQRWYISVEQCHSHPTWQSRPEMSIWHRLRLIKGVIPTASHASTFYQLTSARWTFSLTSVPVTHVLTYLAFLYQTTDDSAHITKLSKTLRYIHLHTRQATCHSFLSRDRNFFRATGILGAT